MLMKKNLRHCNIVLIKRWKNQEWMLKSSKYYIGARRLMIKNWIRKRISNKCLSVNNQQKKVLTPSTIKISTHFNMQQLREEHGEALSDTKDNGTT